ncbi:L-lactate dehydrogenase complex protein LldG [Isoptericola jiangsuensis]|uniref:L-lactate dehydrogenase complex protein LldG n=1 Tax=Isoptericola jiangsuensis TaxID=548579 RepID=A0A2A9ESA1_9MICO|nr:LUD domain-containing protein [Isoptericola jiangsuensis]PFG42017.1 L-lactate dehydrogenase complex protein LldG [Isoptericola jiangsuensis]
MSAREDVLQRVRAALGETGVGTTPAGRVGVAPAPVVVPRAYRVAGADAPGSAAVVEQLVDRLVDYRAHVHHVTDAELPAVVARLLDDLTSRDEDGNGAAGAEGSAAAAPAGATVVVPPGLDPAWLRDLDPAAVRHDSPDAPLTATALDETSAVLTAARVACSETGTIVLDAGPDQGRRAITLVTDVHLCVVRTDQVVQTVPEMIRLLAAHPERPQTWISGPSATSDIELDRVEGVHGPRTLHVLVLAAVAAAVPGA